MVRTLGSSRVKVEGLQALRPREFRVCEEPFRAGDGSLTGFLRGERQYVGLMGEPFARRLHGGGHRMLTGKGGQGRALSESGEA